MNEKGKNYIKNNVNTDSNNRDVKIRERRENHTIFLSKYSKKVIERKEKIEQQPSKNRFGNLQKFRRYNTITSQERDNNIYNNSILNKKNKEKILNSDENNNNCYSAYLIIDNVNSKYRRNAQDAKIEKEQPKFVVRTEEEPKEKNNNYTSINVYISRYIKKEKK